MTYKESKNMAAMNSNYLGMRGDRYEDDGYGYGQGDDDYAPPQMP